MDGNAAPLCSHRPTPPSSPVEASLSPTDHVQPAILDTTKPQRDSISSSEQIAALLTISERLATAAERLAKGLKPASGGKTSEPEEDEPETEPGSTLGYKRVDEMCVSMSYKANDG